MPRQFYAASEAAKRLGISLDTLRRWDRDGRIKTTRDSGNRRLVPAKEIERLRGERAVHFSARNRFRGTVTDVRVEGLIAVEELGLEPGMAATAVVKATSVMVEDS
jgi:excisionase family DNA binding protein